MIKNRFVRATKIEELPLHEQMVIFKNANNETRYLLLRYCNSSRRFLHEAWVAAVGQSAVDTAIANVESQHGDKLMCIQIVPQENGSFKSYIGNDEEVKNTKD